MGRQSNLEVVKRLEPETLWRHFGEIASIPRPSGREEGVLRYIEALAQRLGYPYRRDDAGNLLVVRPGTDRSREPLAFQCHVDMVCEQNTGHGHDFARDPIRLTLREGEPGWLFATGTTLGADNGIGVAAMLTLLEDKAALACDLEFLFTVDEETGLTGAQGLSPSLLRAKTLLNLDTEEENALYVGCAGGMDLDASWPLPRIPASSRDHRLVRLEVKGLKGGHSGIDIDKQRANGIKVLAMALDRLLSPDEWSPSDSPVKGLELGVLSLAGGNARNAIPREAVALLRLGEGLGSASGSHAVGLDALVSGLVQRVQEIQGELGGLFKEADPDLRLAVTVVESGGEGDKRDEDTADRGAIIDPPWLRQWLRGILACPSQPYRFELSIPGLVRTSANLGVLETTDSSLTVRMKLRGSHEGELAQHQREVAGLLMGFGAQVARGGSYCGWQPDLESPLLATAQEVHHLVFGQRAAVKAIHAGLECGLIGDKYPGLRMISFGPQIVNAHSPDEAVAIPSVERFWRYLKALVMTLAGEPG